MIVEIFAGPGGWSTGLRMAGYTGPAIGIEWDLNACRTAKSAGHDRICADVSAYPPTVFTEVAGLIGSPPCQSWSRAGKRLAVIDQTRIYAHVRTVTAAGRWVPYPITGWADERSPLVLEILRWVLTLRPGWFACEQVPDVLPFWQELARALRLFGYFTAAYEVSAEEYGVPQTRVRAILTGSLGAAVTPPTPSHQRYRAGESARAGEPDLFGGIPVSPWVSMAEALGWPGDVEDRSNYGIGGDSTDRGIRSADAPAFTVTSKVGRNLVLRKHRGMGMIERYGERPDRSLTEPSFTVTAGSAGSGPRLSWILRNGPQDNATHRSLDQPAGTIYCSRPGNISWIFERPSTTVCGDARIGRPGHKDRELGESQFTEQSIWVTVQEAAILQGFPADYPWQGTKTAQYQQVGNCVPPPLGAAILRPLLGPDPVRAA